MSKKMQKKRARQQRISRKHTYILIMVIIICLYLVGQCFFDWEWLTETIAAVIVIIAAVAFWLEYHDNKKLNEAQFIMELNEQFLSDEHLSEVEWELEKYFHRFDDREAEKECRKRLEKIFDLNNKERQYLVNYLVHLEGIAALVNNGVIHLDAIDDLMSYRYFIAVNNPVVQDLELLKYPQFYKGCYAIYRNWVNELISQGITPPMYNEEKPDLIERHISEQESKKQSTITETNTATEM